MVNSVRNSSGLTYYKTSQGGIFEESEMKRLLEPLREQVFEELNVLPNQDTKERFENDEEFQNEIWDLFLSKVKGSPLIKENFHSNKYTDLTAEGRLEVYEALFPED